jgi:hypothetical protein
MVYRPPTAKEERAARKWREAKTAKEAWRELRAWALHTSDDVVGEAPMEGRSYGHHEAWTGAGANRLLLFQKPYSMQSFVQQQRGATRGIATASVPHAPHAFDVALLAAHAKLIGGPVGWIGDLDPHGLHTDGALRSGDLDAPSLEANALAVDFIGPDDGWLDELRKTSSTLLQYSIRMPWAEREYWGIVKRMIPGLQQLVGDESIAMLDSGVKIEMESLRDFLPDMLRRRFGD